MYVVSEVDVFVCSLSPNMGKERLIVASEVCISLHCYQNNSFQDIDMKDIDLFFCPSVDVDIDEV